jgi:peptidylprolyl isomerase
MADKHENKDIRVYTKEASYKIGEKIRHEIFNDEGTVLKKIHCDGAYQKIVVKFNKLGQKALVEKKSARRVKMGDHIAIHYKASLKDGKVIETTRNKKPLKLTLGKYKLFPSVEKQIAGMQEGEVKTITLNPEKAYGCYHNDLVMAVSKKAIEDENPQIGDLKMIRKRDNALIEARVKDVKHNHIVLDANHPYAGKSVDYKIELVEILY